MKKPILIILSLAVIMMLGAVGLGIWRKALTKEVPAVTVNSFEECAALGNPIMESYPRQCRHNNQLFVEAIGKNPAGGQCKKVGDPSCPAGFECVPDCGPPVISYPPDAPPTYSCQLKGYIRNCPICLSKNTLIDTPLGPVLIQDLQVGAPVWTVDASGKRVAGTVLLASKTPTPPNHVMVKITFEDGRVLLVSPGHPLVGMGRAKDLAIGDRYDGSRIAGISQAYYGDRYTYDILSSGQTGWYVANGVLLDSTLRPK